MKTIDICDRYKKYQHYQIYLKNRNTHVKKTAAIHSSHCYTYSYNSNRNGFNLNNNASYTKSYQNAVMKKKVFLIKLLKCNEN